MMTERILPRPPSFIDLNLFLVPFDELIDMTRETAMFNRDDFHPLTCQQKGCTHLLPRPPSLIHIKQMKDSEEEEEEEIELEDSEEEIIEPETFEREQVLPRQPSFMHMEEEKRGIIESEIIEHEERQRQEEELQRQEEELQRQEEEELLRQKEELQRQEEELERQEEEEVQRQEAEEVQRQEEELQRQEEQLQRQEEHARNILLAAEQEKERRLAAERQAREAEEEEARIVLDKRQQCVLAEEKAFEQEQALLAAEQRQQLILAEEKEFQDYSYNFRLMIYLHALKADEDRKKLSASTNFEQLAMTALSFGEVAKILEEKLHFKPAKTWVEVESSRVALRKKVEQEDIIPDRIGVVPPSLKAMITLAAMELRPVPEEHKTTYKPVASEASEIGRFMRLKEVVVEAYGTTKLPDKQVARKFPVWSPDRATVEMPKYDNRRSGAFMVVQEAAALGRMKKLKANETTNYNPNNSFAELEEIDVDDIVDEHGHKDFRSSHLTDLHIMHHKKDKVDIWDPANIEQHQYEYKSIDEVELPTETLPVYATKKNELSRIEYLDSISKAVAERSWDRRYRLDRPGADQNIRQSCSCRYCHHPNPYQTHAYRKKWLVQQGLWVEPPEPEPVVIQEKTKDSVYEGDEIIFEEEFYPTEETYSEEVYRELWPEQQGLVEEVMNTGEEIYTEEHEALFEELSPELYPIEEEPTTSSRSTSLVDTLAKAKGSVGIAQNQARVTAGEEAGVESEESETYKMTDGRVVARDSVEKKRQKNAKKEERRAKKKEKRSARKSSDTPKRFFFF
jgi:hypothetical protein